MLENKQDLQFDITHNYKVVRGKKKGMSSFYVVYLLQRFLQLFPCFK